MLRLYARATHWFSVERLSRRIACMALLASLPSLAVGLQADDYIVREHVLNGGAFAAYQFTLRDPRAALDQLLEQRFAGQAPWWAGEPPPRVCFFRPLSSWSLWFDFSHGLPPWWMHLENCLIYAAIAWLVVEIYEQLGLSGAGLGLAALFFSLDLAFAASVGWIAARNTLLAVGFGLACILLHDRARRSGRFALLALASLCFALSLLSAEFGMCTLGYVVAHALGVDRAPVPRRVLALLPYALIAGAYLAHYVSAGYGVVGAGGYYRDVTGSPAAVFLAWIESIPVWLATTATLPIAGLQLFSPEVRVPILVFSLIALALLLPLLAAGWKERPATAMLAGGAVLSLVPLATVFPQERLRFFVALGVYGFLGPWVASSFDAPGRVQRIAARWLWRLHGLLLPLFFIPSLFSAALGFAGGGANALDEVLPRATSPIAILLNPPNFGAAWYQAAMRAYRGQRNPPVFMLYAGNQALEIERRDASTLELRSALGWFREPFGRVRDLARAPFHVGDRVALAHLTVEIREVDGGGAPTRALFSFDRPLDDPGLAFVAWAKSKVASWNVPPVGGHVQLPAAGP